MKVYFNNSMKEYGVMEYENKISLNERARLTEAQVIWALEGEWEKSTRLPRGLISLSRNITKGRKYVIKRAYHERSKS
jgi:hypothetical protein